MIRRAFLQSAAERLVKPGGIVQMSAVVAASDAYEIRLSASWHLVSHLTADMKPEHVEAQLGAMAEQFFRGLLNECYEEMDKRGILIPPPAWVVKELERRAKK